MTTDRPSEDDLIARYFAPIAGAGGLGLRDDAARITPPPGCEIVLTVDGLVAGDTVSTPGPLTLSITALGSVPTGRMVPRDGARAGDALYVSGTIGDAALGLSLRLDRIGSVRRALGEGDAAHLNRRYLLPQPRVALASALLDHASGAMDVSDGLIGDLSKMLRVSEFSAEVDIERIPLSAAARELVLAEPDLLETVLTGGDDYEILASVPPDSTGAFEAAARAAGVAVARIGTVTAGQGAPTFRDARGAPMSFERGSYSHF